MTGTLQNHARKYDQPIDQLSFGYKILPNYRNQEEVAEAMAKMQHGDTLEMDNELPTPNDGVLVHGLFLEAARWDDDTMQLGDALSGQMTSVSTPLCENKADWSIKQCNKKIYPHQRTTAFVRVHLILENSEENKKPNCLS